MTTGFLQQSRREARTARIWAAGLLALFSIIFSGHARALDPSRQPSQYVPENWQIPEGLPETSVQAIAQTADGYLWLGTQEGLARFDGVRFTVVDTGSERVPSDKSISSLLVDRTARLWIGTSSGVAVLENGHFTPFARIAQLEHAPVRSIIEGKGGRIWVGTETGLFEIGGDRALTFSVANGLPDNRIYTLREDRKGVLWVGTAVGLVRFDGKRFENVPLSADNASASITALHEDDDGTIWVGTESGALYRRARDRFEVVGQPGGTMAGPHRFVNALLRDHDGNLWICTGNGLVRWRNGEFRAFPSGLFAHSDLHAILEDKEGSVWVGSFDAGLLRLHDGKFITSGEPEGLKSDVTWTIVPRKSGGLWVGSNLGLVSYVGGSYQQIPGPHGRENIPVRSVVEDRQNALWVGTIGAGVYRLDRGRMKLFDLQTGLSGNKVMALIEDRLSRIWVGTEQGLDLIEHDKITSMQSLLHIGPAPIHLIHEDRAGNLWVATWAQQLFVIGKHGTRHFGMADGLPSDFVLSIHEDERGDLWLGTAGGLALWRDGKLISLARYHDPLRNSILRVLEDDEHNFWFSTNKGLITVPRSALDALAAGATHTADFHVYGIKDGLRSAEFVGGNTSAGTRAPDGLLWFPSIRGIVGVDPSHMLTNTLPPPVVIEQIAVNEAPLTLTDGAEVAPGAEQWEFHYTGLSLVVPERSLFRYRLDGFDKDWVNAGSRRTAYYTRLPPGSYKFRVIASNNDGVWNDTGASFQFTLQPHFYQTAWFALLCVLAVLVAAGACYRWRVGRLKHLADTLTQHVADRTRDLALANGDLELANRKMREAQDTLVTTARQAGMAEIANNVLHNVGNVLNSVNVSAALVCAKLRDSKSAGLEKAVNLMTEHAADLGAFITVDERGKALPGYLKKLVVVQAQEKQAIAEEMESLTKSVDHIKEIVATQQSYSGSTSVAEPVQLKDLMEDALRMNAGSIVHHQIEIVKEFAEVPVVLLDKHLMLQILINLIGNAKQAINPSASQPPQIKLKVDIAESAATPRLRISIEDNGEGIAPENLKRLFSHGFTTRKNGHGFGLHSCALAAKEMKGSIAAFSDGLGTGAAFVVELPMNRVAEAA